MKKNSIFAFIGALIIGLFSNVSAAEIQNFTVTPNGSELSIQWDLLSEEISRNTDGYAVQWSESMNDIRIDKFPKQTVSASTNILRVRSGGFQKSKDYYFRVYSYDKVSRKYKLFNGSKILKWHWNLNGSVKTEYITANDPVINTVEDTTVYNFGQLRVVPFDTRVQLSWSRADISNSEYTGFRILVSKNADLSSPIHKFDTQKSQTKAFIEGLEPQTKYYTAGYFYKKTNGKDSQFGRGTIVPFLTHEKYNTTKEQRYQRSITRLKKQGLGFSTKIGGTQTTTATKTTTTNKTKTPTTSTGIQNRIREIQNQIKDLQAELRKLQNQQRTGKKTTTTKTSSKTSSKKKSLRERILERLGRK